MKTKSTFTIIFFTRKSRSYPNQLSIYVRITINGRRSEMSVKRSVSQNGWDSSKNRGRGNSENIRVLNAYLAQVYNKLLQCHKELIEKDKVVTSDAIKYRYLGEEDDSKSLKELIASTMAI
ncbi:Arm DNA-binding domain-containing protein [uncultured Lutibacter sp.]|uniref:Arm DNA-binding domain-containing protein n=1 Tax=uncultured Lutibacter sp. TaxID=437739 RepID=UPI002611CF11|nr:Arm DNA-binding domain-containing protein [uncultured Lutibacter sp.]